MKKGGGRTTVGVTIDKGMVYSEDPFDRKKDLERKDRFNHQKRLLGKERPFTTTGIHPGTFDNTKHVYGEEDILFKRSCNNAQTKSFCDHPQPWRGTQPAKKGYNKTINRQDYTSDPGREAPKRYRPSTAGVWRPTTNYLSKPNPSVHDNFRNTN